MKRKKYFYYSSAILLSIILFPVVGGGETIGPKEIRWIIVGDLQSWFANAGAEIEYGRRERINEVLQEDQNDGINYPAQFEWGDHSASKAVQIGATNFDDPVSGILYNHKMVAVGPRYANLLNQFMPYEFKLIGKFDHPLVYVDNAMASVMGYRDQVDSVDANQKADRVIVNKMHTSIGIDVTRKIYAFSQQNHSNYFIYEYVFTNTGVYDSEGQKMSPVPTLEDVVFHFQYRYAFGKESIENEWSVYTGVNWGRNTVNHCVGPNVGKNTYFGDKAVPFNAQYSWYGPHSQSPGWADDIGHPDNTNGTVMAAADFVGVVTLHADRSATDNSHDPNQPNTTQYLGSDKDAQSSIDQYNETHMDRLYDFCTAEHPINTHAEQVGMAFADSWGDDNGGYLQAQGFGPYELKEGESVRIVLAEAVAALSRPLNRQITYNWFNNVTSSFILPEGSSTNDRNVYKNAWVWTVEDSLMETFRRADSSYKLIFEQDSNIPEPPPPPDKFEVLAGGNQIKLTWSNSAESSPNFNGYRIFRAEGTHMNIYQMIWSCDVDNVVNEYIDTSPKRGFDYYYYIVTKDDGSQNDIEPGKPLESSKFYTMTNLPARLKKLPGGSFDEIRIVPNPYNISARKIQFGGNAPDRLAFYGLPPYCIIKIYTESGELVKTINHDDTSGDEIWDSLTSSEQLVTSGIYIAYFEVTKTDGGFTKGERTIRKFSITR